jgi:uncharacterized protein YueI
MENNLENRLDRAAAGEHRLDPDQQRKYLGTFRERVVCTIEMDDIYRDDIVAAFSDVVSDLVLKYPVVHMAISGEVSDKTCIDYLKRAADLGVECKIVSEHLNKIEFGIVLYTDDAVNVPETDIETLYPQFFTHVEDKPKKKSFWDSLFGG